MTKIFLYFLLLIALLPAKMLGQNLSQKWQAIKSQADTLEAHKDYQAAKPLRLQEKDIALKKWKKKSEQYATAAYDLGMNYFYSANSKQAQAQNVFVTYMDSAIFFMTKSVEIRKKVLGDTTNRYLLSLHQLGAIYLGCKKYKEAELHIKECIKLKETTGKKDRYYIKSLSTLASIYQMTDKFDESEKLRLQSIGIAGNILDKTSMDYANLLGDFAGFLLMTGKSKESLQYGKEALAISQKVVSQNTFAYIYILNNIGVAYLLQSKYDSALVISQECLALKKEIFGEQHPDYASSLLGLAMIYLELGKYNEALIYYEKYITTVKEIYGGAVPALIQCNNFLCMIYTYKANYLQAYKFGLESLKTSKKLLGEEHSNTMMLLQNLGEVCFSLGKYDSALILVNESQRIRKNMYGEDNLEYIKVEGIIANIYNDMGKSEEALSLCKKSIRIMEEKGLVKQREYIVLQEWSSFIYQSLKQYNKELEVLQKVQNAWLMLLGEENSGYLSALTHLGDIYNEMGKHDSALIVLRKSIKSIKNVLGNNNATHSSALSSLGQTYYMITQYDSALLMYNECLIEQKEIFDIGLEYAKTLKNIAEIYIAQRKFSLATDYLTQNNQILFQNYQKQAISLSEKDRRELWNTIQWNYESMQSLCFLAKDSVPQLITQAYNNQLNTGGILLKGTENIANAIRKNGDEKLMALYNNWLYQKNLVTDWTTWDSAQLKLGNIDLKAETDKANEMEQQLAQQSQVFRNAIDTTSVQWQQVQASLQKGEASVEIVQFRTYEKLGFSDTVHYAAFILTPETKNAPIYVPLPFGNQMENEWAKEYQQYIENPQKDKKDMVSFVRYFKPILAVLKDAKHIYFSVDGIYHKLNLNTLLDQDGKYLVEKYSLHRIASTRDLAKRKSSEEFPANPTAALFGNPTFKISEIEHDSLAAKIQKSGGASVNLYREISEDRDDFSNLPAAKEEVIAVANILKKQNFEVKTYLEKEALEEEVQNLKHPSVVLFATHGKFDETHPKPGMNYHFYNPMYKSKLYFVGARNAILAENDSTQTKHEDGIFYAAEAALLDLQGTDLVVLSACETGLGTIQNGEGVWGLQRAFRIAGAKNLIMSLWAVDDEASQEFMTSFFENWLEKKMSKYAAFQQAQLSLMKKHREKPKMWGGFVLLEGL